MSARRTLQHAPLGVLRRTFKDAKRRDVQLRLMTAEEIARASVQLDRSEEDVWGPRLERLHASLERYGELYGANVVAELPLFAIERALGAEARIPRAKAGVR